MNGFTDVGGFGATFDTADYTDTDSVYPEVVFEKVTAATTQYKAVYQGDFIQNFVQPCTASDPLSIDGINCINVAAAGDTVFGAAEPVGEEDPMLTCIEADKYLAPDGSSCMDEAAITAAKGTLEANDENVQYFSCPQATPVFDFDTGECAASCAVADPVTRTAENAFGVTYCVYDPSTTFYPRVKQIGLKGFSLNFTMEMTEAGIEVLSYVFDVKPGATAEYIAIGATGDWKAYIDGVIATPPELSEFDLPVVEITMPAAVSLITDTHMSYSTEFVWGESAKANAFTLEFAGVSCASKKEGEVYTPEECASALTLTSHPKPTYYGDGLVSGFLNIDPLLDNIKLGYTAEFGKVDPVVSVVNAGYFTYNGISLDIEVTGAENAKTVNQVKIGVDVSIGTQ